MTSRHINRPRDILDDLPDNTRVTTAEAADFCGLARTSWNWRAEHHGIKPARRGNGRTGGKWWKLGDVRTVDQARNAAPGLPGVVLMGQTDEHMAAITTAANTRAGDILVYQVLADGTPYTTGLITTDATRLGEWFPRSSEVGGLPVGSVCLVWNHGRDQQPPYISIVYVNPTDGTVAAQEFVDHERHGLIRRGPLTTTSAACIASRSAVMGTDQ